METSRPKPNSPSEDMLDETSAESFPASDPPGFTTLTGSDEPARLLDFPLEHDPRSGRMEARFPEGVAFLAYRMRDGVMDIYSTETPSSLRGRGIASRIVQRALEYARDNNFVVEPTCPFVRWYLEQHPEWSSIVGH